MPVENVYQNIENVLQRIESIKRRFGVVSGTQEQGSGFAEDLDRALAGENLENGATEEGLAGVPADREAMPAGASAEAMYQEVIDAAAEKFDVPSSVIRAVIKQESNFDSQAVSHKGAMGLMQLMPDTANLLGVENPFDARANIFGGTRYLADLLEIFGGNLNKALAAYNAGPHRVDEDIPNIPETVRFVDKVLENYEQYSNFK
jgi:soluble lytic murein transglycosylase-like protein